MAAPTPVPLPAHGHQPPLASPAMSTSASPALSTARPPVLRLSSHEASASGSATASPAIPKASMAASPVISSGPTPSPRIPSTVTPVPVPGGTQSRPMSRDSGAAAPSSSAAKAHIQSPKMKNKAEDLQGTPPYVELANAVKAAPAGVVRQVLRDYWEKCLLGSDYHLAFMLNAALHQASDIILDRAVRDFGGKMLARSSAVLPQYMSTTDIDTGADILLNKASSEFLDKALARRLETIPARGLVNALARAERLGYDVQDIVEERHDSRPEAVIPSVPAHAPYPPNYAQPPAAYPQQQQKWTAYQPGATPYHPHGAPAKVTPVPPPAPTGAGRPRQVPAKTFHDNAGQVNSPVPLPSSGGKKPPGRFNCANCRRPCTGDKALTYHQNKHACEPTISLERLGKDTCVHCGCRFGSSGGLNYHDKGSVCGAYTATQTSEMMTALRQFVSDGGSQAYGGYGGGRVTSTKVTTMTPGLSVTPGRTRSSSPDVDPYASLDPVSRRNLEAELAQGEEKFGVLFREAMQLPEPERTETINKYKNRYNARQSMTRKKFGVKLRERRSRAQMEAERIRLFGTSDGPSLSGKERVTPQSTPTNNGVSRPPVPSQQLASSQVPSSPLKIVPLSEMGGLTGSSATAETTDPTASLTPSKRRDVPSSSAAPGQVPPASAQPQGTAADPMAIDDSDEAMGEDDRPDSLSDSDSDDDDIRAEK